MGRGSRRHGNPLYSEALYNQFGGVVLGFNGELWRNKFNTFAANDVPMIVAVENGCVDECVRDGMVALAKCSLTSACHLGHRSPCATSAWGPMPPGPQGSHLEELRFLGTGLGFFHFGYLGCEPDQKPKDEPYPSDFRARTYNLRPVFLLADISWARRDLLSTNVPENFSPGLRPLWHIELESRSAESQAARAM